MPAAIALTHNEARGDLTAGLPLRSARTLTAPRVAVVGGGLVTPLGRDAGSTWARLMAGDLITDHAKAAGPWDSSEPRVIAMARCAAREAVAQSGWSADDAYTVVVGTSKGAVESWLSPAEGTSVCGLAEISAAVAGRGPRLTVSGACASGLIAVARAAMLIRSGEAKRVLVVASEASVHPLFLGSFARLGVLARPGVGCMPFDAEREGFLMSEAAAAVCLEASTHEPSGREAAPLAYVERFAIGGDAHHLTAADPGGGVMRRLVASVIDGRAIDLVHAHGTGTRLNDPAELAVFEAAFSDVDSGGRPPCLYSHKGALGHSLGAAGLVAVVLNLTCHARSVAPPNVRTKRPLPARRLEIGPRETQRSIRRSLVAASGFGGASAALTLVSA